MGSGAELAHTQPVMAVDLDRVTVSEPVPGRRTGTLQASSMGEPVYLRMGFEVVAEYQIFILPPAR